MFSKSVVVGSLFFLASVGAAPLKRECMDDPAACLSLGLGHVSSVFSQGSVWATSESTIVSSALSVASSDASSVSSMVHAGPTATPAPVRRDCMDDPQACLSQGLGHASSAFSEGSSYASSAINNPSAMSDASSAMSVAASDASSVWSRVINGPDGAQATGLVEYVTVNGNGQTLTEVSSSGGPVITLAPSGQGTPTTFGGLVFTVATGNVLAAQPSGNGASSDHNSAYRAGVPTAVLGLATIIGAFLAL